MVIIFAAVLVSISQLVGLLVASRLTIAYFERKQADISSTVNGELVKLVKGEPCQSASVLLAMGKVIGSEAGRSVRAGMMGDLGHASREINSAGAEQQLALISDANPLVGQFLGRMGKRGSSKLLNNPLIQLLVGSFLSKGSGGSTAPDNGNKSNVASRIKYGGL